MGSNPIDGSISIYKPRSQLLDESDYQLINKKHIKKSGWRKIQTAFSISDEVIKEDRKEYKDYFVYEITIKAIAPNGRFSFGVGSCSSNERKFTHQEHNVRSTAHTRAKNRAISDLVGGGEIFAEEMTNNTYNNKSLKSEAIEPIQEGIQSYPDTPIENQSTGDNPMTYAQRRLLWMLIDKKSPDEDQRQTWMTKLNTLNKQTASDAIKYLMSL